MITPLRNPLDPAGLIASAKNVACEPTATDQRSVEDDTASTLPSIEAPSSWHEPSPLGDGDPQPLEPNFRSSHRDPVISAPASSKREDEPVPFCISESALARLEAGLHAQEKKQLPRAGQLSAVSGLTPVRENDTSGRESSGLPSQRSVVPERLQTPLPTRSQRYILRGLLFILIVGLVTASAAYSILGWGVLSLEPTSMKPEVVERIPTPQQELQPIDARVNNQTSNEDGKKLEGGAAAPLFPASAPTYSTTSIPSSPPSSSTTLPRPPHRAHLPRHSGSGTRPKAP
jgi:hypothetical protein